MRDVHGAVCLLAPLRASKPSHMIVCTPIERCNAALRTRVLHQKVSKTDQPEHEEMVNRKPRSVLDARRDPALKRRRRAAAFGPVR